ncbi:MAG: D-2-hydroxyacid dehydrogenase [Vicinamibacterales bacterium]|jgi:phosphoglycerate dehydrogenase-like enzyme|nr:D-2-hydroxyacid dehydrogenase [Vicinamibacterales bacterium]
MNTYQRNDGGRAGHRQGFSKILVCARHGDELAAYLTSRRPDLTCRVRSADRCSATDWLWADALVAFTARVDFEDSSIRWVHSTGAGVDGLLGGRPWPTGVTLTRTTGELGDRMAEYCVGHALAQTQRVLAFRQDQSARRWAPVEPAVLRNSTAVIVGTGSVGSAIAARFAALGCETLGVSRRGRPQAPFTRVHAVDALAAVVPDAHWIVLAAPLTPATHGLVSTRVLSRCRAAFLINVARGELLDTTALLAALEAGTLAGAALDVFEEEPLADDSPLWRTPGVVITPHIAGVTHVAEAAEAFLDALPQLEAGEPVSSAVDPARGY